MSDHIHFTAFQMLTPGADGLWRDPANKRDHLSLQFWQQQAKIVEEAGFDALFFADILGVFETRESGTELSVRDAHVFPLLDPFTLVSALSSVTSKLGFIVTASTSYEPPFLLARRFSSLDHFTNGRIGWNIVTSYLDSAAANFGLTNQIPHGERYQRADEYISLVEKLWLESWDDEALLADAQAGIYADPSKVNKIDFHGEYYSVSGPHTVEPSPQRKPVFFQATASENGLEFASRHAEAIYTNASGLEKLRDNVQKVHAQAKTKGRADIPKVFSAVDIVLGDTRLEAVEKANRLASFRSEESALAWNGIDIRKYPRDTKLKDLDTYGTTRPLRSVDGDTEATIADYIAYSKNKKSVFSIVGTKDDVVEQLVHIRNETGVDGFNIGSSNTPGVYEDFAEVISPELRNRGLLPELEEVAPQLRQRLQG